MPAAPLPCRKPRRCRQNIEALSTNRRAAERQKTNGTAGSRDLAQIHGATELLEVRQFRHDCSEASPVSLASPYTAAPCRQTRNVNGRCCHDATRGSAIRKRETFRRARAACRDH